MTIHSATIIDSVSATDTLHAQVKHSFSRQHLIAARHFVKLAVDFEKKGINATEAEKNEHRAYVTGAVVFAIAFLEASINEFYLEAVDRNNNTLAGLLPEHVKVLSHLWNTVEPAPILTKYQIALSVCSKSEFDKGAAPFQGTAALVRMRNALIHYRPEWDDELDEHSKLKDQLNARFAVNALALPGSLWFPHLCLGAGCAQWSVDQVASFMTDFCARLGIANRTP